MNHYATQKSLSDAVDGGGLLVVAQWEAKRGEADKVAAILDRFLPEAQREDGVKLFLISRAKDNPDRAHELRMVRFHVEGIRKLIGREIAPLAGLTIGFNELDGD